MHNSKDPRQLRLFGGARKTSTTEVIDRAIESVREANNAASNPASSIQEIWNKMMENPLMSQIIKDSMEAARKGEPRKHLDPFRGILPEKKEQNMKHAKPIKWELCGTGPAPEYGSQNKSTSFFKEKITDRGKKDQGDPSMP